MCCRRLSDHDISIDGIQQMLNLFSLKSWVQRYHRYPQRIEGEHGDGDIDAFVETQTDTGARQGDSAYQLAKPDLDPFHEL